MVKIQSLNDQQPSTSREFQNSHLIEPQLSKAQPNVINISSSDSECEMLQRNHELKKPEDDKVNIL